MISLHSFSPFPAANSSPASPQVEWPQSTASSSQADLAGEWLGDSPLASWQQYVATFETALADGCPCKSLAECRMLARVLEDQLTYIHLQKHFVQQKTSHPSRTREAAAWQQLEGRLQALHDSLSCQVHLLQAA